MKKGIGNIFFLLVVIFILTPTFLSGQEEENLKRAIRVLDEIPEKNFYYEERSLLADYGGFSSSLLVSNQIVNDEKANGTFVFAVPLDAKFAVDTALAMAEKLNGDSVNILVAFLGGERNVLPEDLGGISHKGLRDLLTLTDMPENRILCYFDADTPPGELVLNHGIRGYVAPLEIIEPLPFLFTVGGISWSFKIRHNAIYKLGLVEGPEILSIIWGEETNGFILSGKTKNVSSEKNILPEDLAELLLEYAGTLNFPVINPDKHYSFFSLPGGRVFFMSEWFIVTLFLVTVGIFLFLYLLYSARYNAVLLFHIRLLIKTFWILLLLLSLLVVSFRFAGLLFSLVISIFVLGFIRFPLGERFYGFAAVFFIFLGTLSAAFIDISYIPFFLWAFFFVFFGASISRPILVFLCTLLAPSLAISALFNVFQTDIGKLIEFFLFSTRNTPGAWEAAFQFALLSLPVFLLAKRFAILAGISYHWKPKPNLYRKYRLIFLSLLIMTVILTIIVQILIPKGRISYEERFIVESKDDRILTLSLGDIVFQDSRILSLTLAAEGSPIRFDVSFISGTGRSLLPVYSAPVPFEREDEGKRINLSLGEHPPNPLSMEIVLPLEFEGFLETAAIYNTWDSAIDPGEKPDSENYVLKVSKSVDLYRSYQENSAMIPSPDESTS